MTHSPTNTIHEIAIDLLSVDPNQPRKNNGDLKPLAESLRRDGQLIPILVRKTEGDRFLIIDGARRYAASLKNGTQTMLAIIAEPENPMDAQFATNYFRQQFNLFELAEIFREIKTQRKWSSTQLAQVVGKSRSTVDSIIGLLKLPPDAIERLQPLAHEAAQEALFRAASATSDAARNQIIKMILERRSTADIRKLGKEKKQPASPSPKQKSTTRSSPAVESAEVTSVTNAQPSPPPPDEEDTEHQVVRLWADAFSSHAVRVDDLIPTIAVTGLTSKKAAGQWLRRNHGRVFGDRMVLLIHVVQRRHLAQLVRIDEVNADYVKTLTQRLNDTQGESN